MNTRTFGRLGWKVSEIGFGAWAIGGDAWGPQDDRESLRALHRAIDCGVNFIDTAQGYGKGHSEELIGRLLRERQGEEIYVATKVPAMPPSPSPPPEHAHGDTAFPADYVIKACEGSLKRLGRDWIDVLQFHTWATRFNVTGSWCEATAKLREQGKIRAAGVSVPDTTPDNVIGALALGTIDAVQVFYNIFEQYPSWNLFPACEKLGIAVIVREPFDEGALTGKYTLATTFPEGDFRSYYFRGRNLPAMVERVEQVKEYVRSTRPGMAMAEFALRFCLRHPAVSTVIPGIRTATQAEENVRASGGPPLTPGELQALARFAWRKDFWHEEVKGNGKGTV